ncbi:DUF1345 domain-containing protein [Micropruina sonneratiae]|uniref:DUF1345 domain-containing protein n=1 Tax=Micropruina sonneratiae TaxID=2986940 RepID=UPI002226608A|nr:DUF1345 domain-containing protein [Micropruina sp. KQZ13P-5]MCW3158509.1 DUF1345 domain-containing protein [Micropruina sp. KQZ13P-5]
MKLGQAWVRTAASVVLGAVAAVVVSGVLDVPAATAVGWIVLTLTFVGWTLLVILRFDADATREHATTEDPSHGASALILTAASVASVAGVGILLAGTRSGGSVSDAFLGAGGVVASWVLVHTLYTVHYARLYYADPSATPVDFSGDQPDYHDFAYLAFTLGMTYQVSDTTLRTRAVRRAVLRHALLSYLLGAVVLACTVNVVVQLAAG